MKSSMSSIPCAFALLGLFALIGCPKAPPPPPPIPATPVTPEVAPPVMPTLAQDLPARLAKLPDTPLDYDRALLDPNESAVMQKLIEASRIIDQIFLLQVAQENTRVRADLVQAATSSEPHRVALELFDIYHGRWDRLAEDEPFVGPLGESGKKPIGAGFYPTDITKAEFEAWLAAHPQDHDSFASSFTVIRREGANLKAIPYSQEYRAQLEPAAALLREAAALTKYPTLKDYLEKRAAAFLSNDYYESDLAWMDLNAPIEIVIGPYEVYEDGLFNYKAAFESFVCVSDKVESDKLKTYEKHMLDMEKHLPIPDKYKNLSRKGGSPIRVVQEAFTAGDARNGVQTAAFNLPNDERVRESKGSKMVMLKNVMEAKFNKSGRPIGTRVLDPSLVPQLSFDAYFTFVLFHELSHSLGPGFITGPDGKRVENRIMLKETYSFIEEAKADVLSSYNVAWGLEKGWIKGFDQTQFAATNVGLLYRSMRFGIDEAHGRGSAVQWNWYREKGAIIPAENGTFKINLPVMKKAVESLATELLTIEALGDYARAKALLEKYGVSNPEIAGLIARMTDIPTDITPVFLAAGEQ